MLLWATATIRARPCPTFQSHAVNSRGKRTSWPAAMWPVRQAFGLPRNHNTNHWYAGRYSSSTATNGQRDIYNVRCCIRFIAKEILVGLVKTVSWPQAKVKY
jgi:hypothetical protein